MTKEGNIDQMSESAVIVSLEDGTMAGARDDRHGRNSQLKPPRASRSKSSDRKGRVSGANGVSSSQIKPPRSTRRVTAAQKKWGDSSLSSVSVRRSGSGRGHDGRVDVEETHPLSRSSLATPRRSTQGGILTDEESEEEGSEPLEDEEIISDQDEVLAGQMSSMTLRGGETQDELNKPLPSRASSRRQPSTGLRHSHQSEDGTAGSTRAPGIIKSNRRSRTDDDVRDPSSRSRRSRSRTSRPKARSASTRRRPNDGSSRDKHRDDDDNDGSGGSAKSSRRRSSRDDDRSLGSTKRRPAVPRRVNSDDDDRSVSSKRSSSRRKRHHSSHRTRKPSSSQKVPSPPENAMSAEFLTNEENDTNKQEDDTDQACNLAKHLQTNPKNQVDKEEQSEESSRYSSTGEHPLTLLQFDPANANHFTLLKQDSKAVVTCEKFIHADGTESELRIRGFKTTNLPTFATPPAELHASSRSLESDCLSDDEVHGRAKKPLSNLAFLITPNRGRRVLNQSGLRRGVKKSISNDGLPRPLIMSRKDREPRNRPGPPGPSASFHNSVKDFIGRWNKSGDFGGVDEEVEEQNGVSRFFQRVEDRKHQALDDYGSD